MELAKEEVVVVLVVVVVAVEVVVGNKGSEFLVVVGNRLPYRPYWIEIVP